MWVKLIVNEYIVREQFTRKCLKGIKLPGYPDSLNDVVNEMFTHTKGIWEDVCALLKDQSIFGGAPEKELIYE